MRNLERFDLSLPRVVIDSIKKEANIRCIHPRTMGRILMVEKIKEMTGIAPDQSLPTDVGTIPDVIPPTGVSVDENGS